MPIVSIVIRTFSSEWGWANDIVRHSKSMKHKKREESHNEQPRLNVFMKNRPLDLSVQQCELTDKKEKEAREREEAEAREKNLRRILFMLR